MSSNTSYSMLGISMLSASFSRYPPLNMARKASLRSARKGEGGVQRVSLGPSLYGCLRIPSQLLAAKGASAHDQRAPQHTPHTHPAAHLDASSAMRCA